MQALLDQDNSAVATVVNTAATIRIAPAGIVQWRVKQIGVELVGQPTAVAPAGAAGALRKNGALVSPFMPDQDALGQEPWIMLRPGDALTAEWTGMTNGQQVRAFWIYDIVGWGE